MKCQIAWFYHDSYPMLARSGEAYMPTLYGDKIGRRRLDTHFQGFVELRISL